MSKRYFTDSHVFLQVGNVALQI